MSCLVPRGGGFPMTGGRFEPSRVAETEERGAWDTQAESWSETEPLEDAEAWDDDEALANPDAYDQLERRLMHERAGGPRFSRFRAAMTDCSEAVAKIEFLTEP